MLQLLRSDDKTQSGALAIAVLATTVALGATFLPWGRSGQTRRNSYELVHVAVRFEILSPGLERLTPLWYLVPAAAGAAWLAASLRRPRLAATLCLVVGLLSVVAATLTKQSPLAAEVGVGIAQAAGIVATLAGLTRLTMTTRSTPDAG